MRVRAFLSGARLGAVVALAALLAGASGCASDTRQARPVAPLSPSAGPSAASRSPSPSATPSGPTAASAAAFVRAYYAAVNKSAVTGNATGLAKYSTKGCKTCQDYVDSTRHYQRRGQRLDGKPFNLRYVHAYPVEQTATTVDLELSSPAQNVTDSRGRKLEQLPSRGAYAASAALVWTGGRWLVTDITEFP